VRCCSGCDRWWVDWTYVLVSRLSVGSLVLVRIHIRYSSRYLGWRGREIAGVVLQVIELSLLDLLTNNVDVEREVHLLSSLEDESWKQTHDRRDENVCPKIQAPVHLRASFVKLGASGE
jgi:hypothetical protein